MLLLVGGGKGKDEGYVDVCVRVCVMCCIVVFMCVWVGLLRSPGV